MQKCKASSEFLAFFFRKLISPSATLFLESTCLYIYTRKDQPSSRAPLPLSTSRTELESAATVAVQIALESMHGSSAQLRARQLAQVPSQHPRRGRLSRRRVHSCRASSPSQRLDRLQISQTGIARSPQGALHQGAVVHPDALRRRQEAEAR